MYTFKPSALGGLKTIAIPLFENQTTEPELREMLTNKLSQAFVNDNTLKVVPQQQADGILHGAIINYAREAYTYSQAEVVSEYICRVTVKWEVVDRRSQKTVVGEDKMMDWGTYNASNGETDTDGKNRAIDKIVDDILTKTVKGW